ncbi:hypothetical protein HO173_009074 [Letharia columbiana]|uniref:Heterokaryon incompatibility domain-containing protein n=1 Tax=Letharia columbiana TaxID=112416 RepID=A0A8H6FQ34_9LECA|nr:uncharacterized protein HO173_009074 [Letharia columbiana]KAF6232635.1 hypothetical protein HO173_009074 [Letharia columbiana]
MRMKLPRLIRRGSQLPLKEQDKASSPPSNKPLPQPQKDCRILCILPGRASDPVVCTTSVISLAEAAGRYDALSYCWGSKDRTRPIVCDNAPFSVTPNLECALKRLRAPDIARNFWIDQLCIDQDNLREKEQQLGLMAGIYRRSSRLLIWLGDDEDDSRKANKIIDRLLKLDQIAGLGNKYSNDDVSQQTRGSIGLDQLKSHGLPGPKDTGWLELRSLLSRPWFSRIWTVQEAAVATKTDILWGKEYSLSWQGMLSIMVLVREHLPRTLLGSDIFFRGLPADSVYRIAATMRTLEDGTHHDLFNLALTYKAYGAAKPQDKLYALLNISNSSQTADYEKSAETTFHEMAHQTINKVYQEIARRPEELSQQQWHPYPDILQGPHLRMVALICAAGIANQQISLPSWVPDWTFDSFPAPIWTRKTCHRIPASANTFDWPGARPTNLTLERSTIVSSNLAEMQWSAEGGTLIGSATLPGTIQIKGLICDVISRRGFAKVDIGKPLEHEEQQKALMEWLLEADDMADLGIEASYGGGADAELFRRALLFDESMLQAPEIQRPELLKTLRFAKHPRFASTMKRKLQPWDYLQAIQNIPGRTFFVTQGGRMGLAPHSTHMYDKLCVLPGFEVPLVLRPDGNEFRLVGECYAGNDDMMPGGSEYSRMTPEWISIK